MEPTAIETGLSLRETGIALLRQAVNRELIGHCCEIASQFYREKEALIQTDGADAVQKTLPAGQKYLAAASSFTLRRFLQRRIAAVFCTRSPAVPPETSLNMPWADAGCATWIKRGSAANTRHTVTRPATRRTHGIRMAR